MLPVAVRISTYKAPRIWSQVVRRGMFVGWEPAGLTRQRRRLQILLVGWEPVSRLAADQGATSQTRP